MKPVDEVSRAVTAEEILGDYVAVRALEDGVTIIGLTRGRETKFHHTEKLDKGEVMLLQFTELTAAMKFRGKAVVYCKHGQIPVDS
ncbi:MAG: trp RNA-binding attenuation protein MtrB [Bacillota bacterium]|nr:trp RNA-binding attenuation protein MtrB [Bacillota bacterium]